MDKIVVLDGYTLNPGDLSWDGLKKLGDATIYDRTAPEDIVSRIGDAAYVYTNKTPITKETLDRCKNIKFIGVLATGYNVVDFEEAAKRGIPVCNVPTYGTAAVSQYVFALLLEICHHVGHHNHAVKEGRWTHNDDWCFWDYPLIELHNKTMGIIGFGRIGQDVAKIANAMGMNVVCYDQYQNKSLEHDALHYVSLDELFQKSDVISLHCPLFKETENIINKESISKMKKGVILINTSRGPLIDEQALKEGLDSGQIFGAASDVVVKEPIPADNVLLGCKNMIITPHIAWAPVESRDRLLQVAVKNLASFIQGTTINAVNLK